jgi:short-subunit dehydrogenase
LVVGWRKGAEVNLAGKVFVVTGAAGGIGQALVKLLLERGAVVWAADRPGSDLSPLHEYASQNGFELKEVYFDLTDTKAIESGFRTIVEATPRLEAWINNAGLSGLGDFFKQPEAVFDRVMQVNLNALVQLTRLAASHMEKIGEGKILNIASVAGVVPAPYLVAYSTSKHAVIGFTRALREELRLKSSPVKLLLAAPGFVATPMIQDSKAIAFPEWLQWAVSTPHQVASELMSALMSGAEEVTPTWNGKLMQMLHSVFPKTTRRQARALLAPSFRDWLLGRYQMEK